jgi:hypothetical protein
VKDRVRTKFYLVCKVLTVVRGGGHGGGLMEGKRFLLMSSVFLLPPEDSRLLPDHEVLHGVSKSKAKKYFD